MKSSEEIADEIQSEALEENVPYYADMIESYADRIATATLEELKEKVDGEQYDSDWGGEDTEYYRGYNDSIKEIITLIDEAIND